MDNSFVLMTGTDLKVSALCMGTATIGSTFDESISFNLLDTFVEYGGNFLDTAHNYADWAYPVRSVSEKTIGKWMKVRRNREKIILGTKVAQINMETMHVRLSENELISDLDECLSCLQTDYIDLLWLHRDDENIPVEYIIDMMNKQVTAGKIRYFGCSNWSAHRIKQAYDFVSEKKEFTSFIANQPMWSCALINSESLSDKTVKVMDDYMFCLHKKHQLTAVPFTSQARGFFTKLHTGTGTALDKIYGSLENEMRFERIKKVSQDLSRSIGAVSLAYLKSQPFPTVPIIGFKDKNQLIENLKVMDFLLEPDTVLYIKGCDLLF